MSKEIVLRDFRANMVTFLDELIEQFPSETDFILARLMVKDTISPEIIMSHFIKEILPYKDFIDKRDESFFMDSKASLFGNLNTGNGRVNHFKLLWKSSALDTEDREIIWKWFDTFIFLAEQYKKKNEV